MRSQRRAPYRGGLDPDDADGGDDDDGGDDAARRNGFIQFTGGKPPHDGLIPSVSGSGFPAQEDVDQAWWKRGHQIGLWGGTRCPSKRYTR